MSADHFKNDDNPSDESTYPSVARLIDQPAETELDAVEPMPGVETLDENDFVFDDITAQNNENLVQEPNPERQKRRIVLIRKLKEKVSDAYRFLRQSPNRIVTEAQLAQNGLYRVGNRLTQKYDEIRLVANFNTREKARKKLQEARDNQENRIIEGGLRNFLRDRANKNRMNQDIKESIEEVNRIIVVTHRTGDRLNQTVQRYNSKNPESSNLEPIIAGEDPTVRESKIEAMLNTAQALRGVDDLTATALLRDAQALQKLTQDYKIAIDRRNNAYRTRLYLGNQNMVNQNQRAVQAEVRIGQLREDRANDQIYSNELEDQRRKLVERRIAPEETFQKTMLNMPYPELGTIPNRPVMQVPDTQVAEAAFNFGNGVTRPIRAQRVIPKPDLSNEDTGKTRELETPIVHNTAELSPAQAPLEKSSIAEIQTEGESEPEESFGDDFLKVFKELRALTVLGLSIQDARYLLENGLDANNINKDEINTVKEIIAARRKNKPETAQVESPPNSAGSRKATSSFE